MITNVFFVFAKNKPVKYNIPKFGGRKLSCFCEEINFKAVFFFFKAKKTIKKTKTLALRAFVYLLKILVIL